MTESIADRYRRRASGFAATIAEVPDYAWHEPSPCEGWEAIDVVRHVVVTQGIFTGLIDRPIESSIDVDEDAAGAFAEAVAQTQALLEDREAATSPYEGHFGRSTYEEAVDQFASFDLVVHRWDLARAVGIDIALDPEDVTGVLEGIPHLSPEMLAAFRSPGVFGPEIEAPEGADDQTRMLAFVGRRAW